MLEVESSEKKKRSSNKMRNGAKGSMVSGSGEAVTATDTTRHRKGHGSGHKRKLHQQSSTGVSNASVVPYSNNNNGVAGVSANNITNTGSSRSHSKHGGSNRKSHSIKHKSSKVQIPLLINANNAHSIKIQQESR